jgi:amino acid transporter
MVEFLIVGALAVTLIAKAGGHNTVSVFTTSHADVKGFVGFSGVFGAMIYAIYAFVGFGHVVPLAEEAKNPRRNVMLAALLSPVILGVFIIFCTYLVCAEVDGDGCVRGGRATTSCCTASSRSRRFRS